MPLNWHEVQGASLSDSLGVGAFVRKVEQQGFGG